MIDESPKIQEIIRQLCEAEGSQAMFARKIGATPQKVNNWISGRNGLSADMLFAISEIYEIPMEQLLDASNLDISLVGERGKVDPVTNEISCYFRMMTDTQKRAIVNVARAMVE